MSTLQIVKLMDSEPVQQQRILLCPSDALENSGSAVSFEVSYYAQQCSAFAVRYDGAVYAYLNRCSHVPMELDWLPNQVFDSSGHWLLCSTHGAMYRPDTGACAGGPCRGGLTKIQLSEKDGHVYWLPDQRFSPVVS